MTVQWIMNANVRGKVAVGSTVAAVVLTVGILFGGSAAEASCIHQSNLEWHLESSDVVFLGSVTDLANRGRWATFRVEEVWKGDPGTDRIQVRAGPADGPNGPSATSIDRIYVAGERYLVFASDVSRRPESHFGEGARWIDSACSATRPYEPNLDRLRPEGVVPMSSDTVASDSVVTPLMLAAVVTLAAGVVPAIVLRRRSRAR